MQSVLLEIMEDSLSNLLIVYCYRSPLKFMYNYIHVIFKRLTLGTS